MRRQSLLITLITLPLIFVSAIFATAAEQHTIYLPAVQNNYDPQFVWMEPVTPTLEPRPVNKMFLITDNEQRPHIVWQTQYTPRFIYHTMLSQGTWTTPTAVAELNGESRLTTAPMLDNQGRINLLWRNAVSTPDDVCQFIYAYFENDSWSAPETIYEQNDSCTSIFGGYSGLIQRQDNLIHAALQTSSGLLYTRNAGSVWQTSQSVPRPDRLNWTWLDKNGRIHLFSTGTGFENTEIYYTIWANGTTLLNNHRIQGRMYGVTTQFDGRNLHIFDQDQVSIPGDTLLGLYHQCLDGETRATSSWKPLSGQHYATSPTAGTDWNGRTAIAWRNQTDGRIQLNLWQDCTLLKEKQMPFGEEKSWLPTAVAVNQEAGRLCILHTIRYERTPYNVVCARIQ